MTKAAQSGKKSLRRTPLPYLWKPLVIVLLLVAGFLLHLSGVIDTQKMLAIARAFARRDWIVPIAILVLMQVILYTFALPGSSMLWVAAPLYAPMTAGLVLSVGGTLGGISAWWLACQLGEPWVEHHGHGHVYRLLHGNNHFFTVFALRVFPGFPHSLINYAAGSLRTPLIHFIPATALGMFIKYYLYSVVIHQTATAATVKALLVFPVYGPLLGLSVLALAGAWARRKMDTRTQPAP